ncbi:MAG: alpha/beta hydrolase [Sumerlaeia bacterium]
MMTTTLSRFLLSILCLLAVASAVPAFARDPGSKSVPLATANDAASTQSLRAFLGIPPNRPLLTDRDKPDAPAPINRVTFQSLDNLVVLAGKVILAPDPKADAVIVLTGFPATYGDYSDIGRELLGAGYSVMILDMRGIGDSKRRVNGQPFDLASMSPRDSKGFARTPDDVAAAAQWLREQNFVHRQSKIFVLSMMGAVNPAGIALGEHARDLAGAIMISPLPAGGGIDARNGLKVIQGRPILVLSGEEDRHARDVTDRLQEVNPDVKEEWLPGSASGFPILNHPEGRKKILAFLAEHDSQP